MIELLVVGFVAGIVAGISPCILPVLPVILVAGATSPGNTAPAPSSASVSPPRRRFLGISARPLAIVSGLVLSFSVLVLAGSELISALHLPATFLRDAGVVVLVVVGVGFLVPKVAEVLERPFTRLRLRDPRGVRGGFVVGLALGLVFVPCAGPVLAALTVLGATDRVGLTAVALAVAFGLGVSVPLLVVALAGSGLAARLKALRQRATLLRRAGGLVLIAMALAIGFNSFAGLQRDIPGYTSALQSHLEGSSTVRGDLSKLTGNSSSSLAHCPPETAGLVECGPAPNFEKITAWLNTPGGRPLTIAGLQGKVVLVDFWTYSCINCQRSLPHVEAWYREYAKYGFVVVGVHTPEFAFEHVVSNVRAEAAALGVHYPVAIDDDYGTWDAYDNESWPAEYLIDASGDVRHVDFGEGGYPTTESLIRKLLVQAHPGLVLPPPTDVPNLTPTSEMSPETYVGYDRLEFLVPPDVAEDMPYDYHLPTSVPPGEMAWGGVWDDHAEEATAGKGAEIELDFVASDVYLVLGGSGTLHVSLPGGRDARTIAVGGIPRLYTLFSSPASTEAVLTIRATPGIEAYDFTFG